MPQDENASVCRPLLVEFDSRLTNNQAMEKLYKLKNATDEFKRLSIAHDMTVSEREQCRALVEEAQQKEALEQGNFVYRVRGQPGVLTVVQLKKNRA